MKVKTCDGRVIQIRKSDLDAYQVFFGRLVEKDGLWVPKWKQT